MATKRILVMACWLLSASLLRAQTKTTDYDRKWRIVDSLLNKKGLPESALAEINRIYVLARQEHNDGQQIKALVYRISAGKNKDEDDTAGIAVLETAVREAAQPARPILQSILAGAYWNYFQSRRWTFYNRTATVNFVKNDMATWTIDDFHKKIGSLYLASLQDEKLLQQTRLENYEPILFKGNVRYLRPTLFDLLAHEALAYFKNDEPDVNQPANVFEIDDPAVFADAAIFAGHVFHSGDSSSLHYYALLLLQRLIRWHLADGRRRTAGAQGGVTNGRVGASDGWPDALIDVDIERLRFANDYAVNDRKDELYRQALMGITARYGDLPAAAAAWYLQAKQEADRDDAGASGGAGGKASAVAICQRVIAQPDSSEGKTDCQILLQSILRKELTLQVEKVNLPGKPMRALVSWNNFTQLHLRLIRLDSLPKNVPANNTWEESYWTKLLGLPVYRSFDQALPATADYRLHRTEMAIGSLPSGAYALMASSGPGWDRKTGVMTVQYFYVSSIAYINQLENFFVLNRESGQPLSGATVQLWDGVYSARASATQLVRAESYRTDEQGHFMLDTSRPGPLRAVRYLEIRAGGDRLFMTDQGMAPYYLYTQEEPVKPDKEDFERRNARTFLFLDRSIYRPGQTVYFKGIDLTTDYDTRQSKIWMGRPSKVGLYNANGEKVDSLDLTTNEFGSFHASFRLPEHQLNGQFRITDETTGSSASFSVEEYKRPGFYITYDKPKGSYRVGDCIRLTASVKAYAGNDLDGATVKYRVMRQARFPHWWLFWRGGMPVSDGQEIAHGEGKTDGRGVFQVVYAALPDRKVSRSSDPQFEYTVTADVTDINGETRSGGTTIVAAYSVINLSIGLAGDGGAAGSASNRLSADSLKAVSVSTTNLSGEPVASRVHIAIYPLQSPKRLIRARLWEAPDLWVLPEAVFRDSFPVDEYRQETKKESWARGAMIWEATDTTGSGGGTGDAADAASGAGMADFRVPAGRLSAGWWAIEASTVDRYGQEVKALHYVELYDSRTGKPANPEYNWTADGQQVVEPGEKAHVATGSSAADVYVIRMIERASKSKPAYPRGIRGAIQKTDGNFSYFRLDKEKKDTEWTVTEADRGGLGISDVFVKDNRLYTHLSTVQVPWTNKELQIRYATFRDKTEPGAEEKWAVTIGGYKGGQVSAEVLASMYDASLDQFAPHDWSVPDLYPRYSGGGYWQTSANFQPVLSQERVRQEGNVSFYYMKVYDRLLTVRSNGSGIITARGQRSNTILVNGKRFQPDGVAKFDANYAGAVDQLKRLPSVQVENVTSALEGRVAGIAITPAAPGAEGGQAPPPEVKLRKNFNETAFFFPDLRTDSAGNVSFSFTMPEALTRWKWMTLAHSRDLAFGYSEKTLVTQKELMVQPNVPRFLREGDRMNLSVKIVNMTDSEMTGQTGLQLTDPTTGETADGWFVNRQPNQYFTVAARSSVVVDFPLDIPFQYNRPLTYRIVAQAGNYSDGEEATLPVVSNRMLVTETLPLNMPGDGTRSFHFDKLLKSGSSETLNNHALTVEFTANPAWYAVQALPYLIEYPYECAEQTFNRFYANALASKIVNSSPRLAQVFAAWRTTDTAALLSNLQKNQELKSILLEETPWVLQGKSEEQQKKNVAVLFDLVRMSRELAAAIDKLREMQSADGGFVWFKGGRDDRYITQYILTGIGHLQQLQAVPAALAGKVKEMVAAALPYLDKQIVGDYQRTVKAGAAAAGMKGGGGAAAAAGGAGIGGGVRWIGELPVQYLYMRSYFNDYGIPGNVLPAVSYYRKKAQQGWLQGSKYMQGMIALALFRTGDVQTARNIIASLRQNAIRDEEKGMYWKGMDGGYYWYQAPIEIQSLLIEAFREIGGDTAIDRDLKTWLLRQKQTHNWPTTKATADACYALLLGGEDWLSAEREIGIHLGDKTVQWGAGVGGGGTTGAGTGAVGSGAGAVGSGAGEVGTGYYKKVFDAPFVNPSMGNITVTMKTRSGGTSPGGSSSGGAANKVGGSPAWGAVYWQYFDQLDHITPSGGGKTPLRLVKKLFVQRNTDRGPVLDPLTDNGTLKVGDRVVVRIELQADRDLEYVHMKDMRGACLEPVDVISQYKWQGGLGYYETTKDASTEFFFSEVPRGTYVFEYTLLAGQTGNFSNGVTSIECMYAPEFAFHSEGIRVNVEGAP
jgi:Bacterial Alpha-2-macroglobulin MG10 domain/Alpha-2-macroglobulin family/MG2 domain